MSPKAGFVGHQTGIKKIQYKERKEKPNVLIWQRNYYKTCLQYLDPRPKQEEKTNLNYVMGWAGRDSVR